MSRFPKVFCEIINKNSSYNSAFGGGIWIGEKYIVIGWGNFLYEILVSLGFSDNEAMSAKWRLYVSKHFPDKEQPYIRNYVKLTNFVLKNVLEMLRNKVIEKRISERSSQVTEYNNQQLVIEKLNHSLCRNWNTW